jgi:ubiquinone/menaquinone biosynthesis C-methylase UbiE
MFLNEVRGGIPYAAAQLDVMLRVLGLAERPIDRFLDLGCGDGTVARTVLNRFPSAEAVLLDFSEPMLAAARSHLLDASCHMLQVDFGDSMWVSSVADWAPFDAVVSGYAIHHQPDNRKRSLYAEIYELLAPGGVFVNVEHVAPATPRISALSDELFVDSLTAHNRRLGGQKTREQIASDYVQRPDKAANILAPVEDQCAWLRAIGFVDVDCYFKIFELAVFGGRRPAPKD